MMRGCGVQCIYITETLKLNIIPEPVRLDVAVKNRLGGAERVDYHYQT